MDNQEDKVLSRDTKPLPDLSQIVTEEPTMEELFEMEGMQQAPLAAEEPEEEVISEEETISETEEPVTGDTVRLDTLAVIEAADEATEDAIHVDDEEEAEAAEEADAESDGSEDEEVKAKEPIPFNPRAKLRDLKRKLIAGPEKRYYDLSEIGVGKLQVSIGLNVLIVALCAGAAVLFAGGAVPPNRMRLLIFSQMLAMLVSALLGSYALLDGAADLLKGRFSMNTMMMMTFVACCVDVGFCLNELRVPCCAAFSLEMVMALWQRYEKRTTEMGQMDTLRKATRLNSVVKVKDFYEGRPGFLRSEGQVEDFMDNYDQTTGPEKAQYTYIFISFLACIAIAVLTGLRHGASMAVRIFSTSLLVATPASFFVALTRPMAVLERRLHMVGTVFCGWKGVKALSGRAVFPVKDTDLFPKGSAKLNGVKFYGDRKPDEVVEYATSLIVRNGGNLVPVFQQLLDSRRGETYEVVNYRDYERVGIGGEVCDEPVLLGSMKFLQDMGVDIPGGTMVNQAVYCAIDGQLCAVFAINYAKARASAAGIVSLCGYRKLNPVMLCEDFMLNDEFLRSKFSINSRRVIFPPREVREELAARQIDEDSVSLALPTQEGLASFAYAVTGARVLRTACRLGLAIHILGGMLGMLVMLALGFLGASYLLTPMNVLLYQLVWMIPGLLATNWTKIV